MTPVKLFMGVPSHCLTLARNSPLRGGGGIPDEGERRQRGGARAGEGGAAAPRVSGPRAGAFPAPGRAASAPAAAHPAAADRQGGIARRRRAGGGPGGGAGGGERQ